MCISITCCTTKKPRVQNTQFEFMHLLWYFARVEILVRFTMGSMSSCICILYLTLFYWTILFTDIYWLYKPGLVLAQQSPKGILIFGSLCRWKGVKNYLRIFRHRLSENLKMIDKSYHGMMSRSTKQY